MTTDYKLNEVTVCVSFEMLGLPKDGILGERRGREGEEDKENVKMFAASYPCRKLSM